MDAAAFEDGGSGAQRSGARRGEDVARFPTEGQRRPGIGGRYSLGGGRDLLRDVGEQGTKSTVTLEMFGTPEIRGVSGPTAMWVVPGRNVRPRGRCLTSGVDAPAGAAPKAAAISTMAITAAPPVHPAGHHRAQRVPQLADSLTDPPPFIFGQGRALTLPVGP